MPDGGGAAGRPREGALGGERIAEITTELQGGPQAILLTASQERSASWL